MVSTPPPARPSDSDTVVTTERHLLEMKLMHHYSTSTFETLPHVSSDEYVWKHFVPQKGLSYPFVLDSIMSLSAMHLAFLEPSNNWTHTALEYQDRAVSGFRNVLNHITPQNCEAAFVCSVLITMLNFALPGICEERGSTDAVADLLSTRFMLQGVTAVVLQAQEQIRKGPFGIWQFKDLLINVKDMDASSPATPEAHVSVGDAFKRLQSIKRTLKLDINEPYTATIGWLEKAFHLYCSDRSTAGLFSWPILVDQGFVDLLKQGDSLATLVFAHYGAVLHLLHDRWWARNAGRSIVEQLLPSLRDSDPTWSDTVDWLCERVRHDQ